MNLAARLAARAELGSISLPAELLEHSRTRWELGPSSALRLKGLSEPVYAVSLGAAPRRSSTRPTPRWSAGPSSWPRSSPPSTRWPTGPAAWSPWWARRGSGRPARRRGAGRGRGLPGAHRRRGAQRRERALCHHPAAARPGARARRRPRPRGCAAQGSRRGRGDAIRTSSRCCRCWAWSSASTWTRRQPRASSVRSSARTPCTAWWSRCSWPPCRRRPCSSSRTPTWSTATARGCSSRSRRGAQTSPGCC